MPRHCRPCVLQMITMCVLGKGFMQQTLVARDDYCNPNGSLQKGIAECMSGEADFGEGPSWGLWVKGFWWDRRTKKACLGCLTNALV